MMGRKNVVNHSSRRGRVCSAGGGGGGGGGRGGGVSIGRVDEQCPAVGHVNIVDLTVADTRHIASSSSSSHVFFL